MPKLTSNDCKVAICDHIQKNYATIRSMVDMHFLEVCATPGTAAEERWAWSKSLWKRALKGKKPTGEVVRVFGEPHCDLHAVTISNPEDTEILSVEVHPKNVYSFLGGFYGDGENISKGYLK